MKTLSELMRAIDNYAACRTPGACKELRRAIIDDLKESVRDSMRLDAIELIGGLPGGLLIYDPTKYTARADTKGIPLVPGVHGQTLRQGVDSCFQHVEL